MVASVLLRLMGKDINYDSFGFIVIRLIYVGVGYRDRAAPAGLRSRQVLWLSPQVHPNVRPARLSHHLSHFHSTHFVSLINFVLWPLRLRNPPLVSVSVSIGLPSLTIFFLCSFISRTRLFPCHDPPFAGFLSFRFVTRCYT